MQTLRNKNIGYPHKNIGYPLSVIISHAYQMNILAFDMHIYERLYKLYIPIVSPMT